MCRPQFELPTENVKVRFRYSLPEQNRFVGTCIKPLYQNQVTYRQAYQGNLGLARALIESVYAVSERVQLF